MCYIQSVLDDKSLSEMKIEMNEVEDGDRNEDIVENEETPVASGSGTRLTLQDRTQIRPTGRTLLGGTQLSHTIIDYPWKKMLLEQAIKVEKDDTVALRNQCHCHHWSSQ